MQSTQVCIPEGIEKPPIPLSELKESFIERIADTILNTIANGEQPTIPQSSQTPLVQYFEQSLQELNDGYETLKDNITNRWPIKSSQQAYNNLLDSLADIKALVSMAATQMTKIKDLAILSEHPNSNNNG
jgi:hypothetical protein